MSAGSSTIGAHKLTHRSRVTNGSRFLSGVDGRSQWARRARDIMRLHVSDLGGDTAISEAERSLVRRASVLSTELERLEVKFATAGQASAEDLDLYSRASGTLRRLLEAVGVGRRVIDAVPSLSQYLSAKSASRAERQGRQQADDEIADAEVVDEPTPASDHPRAAEASP